MPRDIAESESKSPVAGGISVSTPDMASLVSAFDWGTTPLGPAAQWPESLKTVVRILLTSRFAMWMGWGPELTFIYNDAYARMTLGKKHPWALGRPASEVWSEIWADIGPRVQRVLQTQEASWDEELLLFLERNGYTEETYHTFSYSPLTRARWRDRGAALCSHRRDRTSDWRAAGDVAAHARVHPWRVDYRTGVALRSNADSRQTKGIYHSR